MRRSNIRYGMRATIASLIAAIPAMLLLPYNALCAESASLTSPAGITIQEIENGGGRPQTKPEISKVGEKVATGRRTGGPGRGKLGFLYADENGKTLYTYDTDTTPGKSQCYDKCAEAWPPALVPKGAKPAGDWTVVVRNDKAKQWAYKGKPLYTFRKDEDVGDKKGDGVQKVWHIIGVDPAAEMQLPYDLTVTTSQMANGYALADAKQRTLYAFSGNIEKESRCADRACVLKWEPMHAGALAHGIGEFSIIQRSDGTDQWAFKGKPLFTFSGDVEPGGINGAGLDKKYQVALVAENFIPKVASIRYDNARGPILATSNGMTLYRRDTSYHNANGHGIPGSTPGNPGVGRAMGTISCSGACLNEWKPLQPQAAELPSGFWSIYTREDGSRQWAYKGFALYTYNYDLKPGDRLGSELYEPIVADDPNMDVYGLGIVANDTLAAFYWQYAEP